MKLFEVVIVDTTSTKKATMTEEALRKVVFDMNVELAKKKKQHSCTMINSQNGKSSTVHIKYLEN